MSRKVEEHVIFLCKVKTETYQATNIPIDVLLCYKQECMAMVPLKFTPIKMIISSLYGYKITGVLYLEVIESLDETELVYHSIFWLITTSKI